MILTGLYPVRGRILVVSTDRWLKESFKDETWVCSSRTIKFHILACFYHHFLSKAASYTAAYFFSSWKLPGLIILILFLSVSAQAQNTKGDRAERAGSSSKRENRFTSPFKKKKKKGAASYNRAQARGSSRANSARKPAKAGKASQKIYSQKTVFTHNNSSKPRDSEKAYRGRAPGTRVSVRSSSGKNRNVYPQFGRYGRNASQPRDVQRPVSNKSTLARLNKLQGDPQSSPPRKKKKVVPRSASRSYTARKSINVYANFARPKRKSGDQPVTRDIAGRKLRTKNYETPRREVIAPTTTPYYGRKRVGDRPYKGRASGNYRSATRTGQRAWTGDIARRRVRGRNFSSKKEIESTTNLGLPKRKVRDRYGDRPYTGRAGGGFRSASQPGEKRTGKGALPPRVPGIGANGVNYQGRLKAGKPLKGGGSRSGRAWNNKGVPVPVRTPLNGRQAASFQGNIKGSKPLKGGGSRSGRGWNNKGTPIPVRTPLNGRQAASFQGNIKGSRPLKGGGSVSGRAWNNKGNAIPVRTPRVTPNWERKRFEPRPAMQNQGEEFTGVIKSQRPLKGGGSVSGKLWNNKEKAIPVRTPKIVPAWDKKQIDNRPPMKNQGEEFTGYIRRPRFWKDYIKHPNSHEASLKKKRPTDGTFRAGGLQVPVRQRDYVRNKNTAEEALPKQKPTEGTYQTGELQIKMKQREVGYRKNAPEGALPGIKPSKETVKASQYARGVRRTWDYVHNPSSSDEALKVREPGKAFGRSTDYQGNIKMQKFRLFEKNRELHPDAKFVKTNKNNVDGERDIFTNFKLWWARLFKKQENQPDHLKEKGPKPRYDKGEDGLWYE